MITEKVHPKTFYTALFGTVLFLGSSVAFAQVKIGTNPTAINPVNNLEVEASTTGRRTSVDKTTGQVTIKDGTEGSGKILTSDANGAASWQAPSVQDVPVFFSVYKSTGSNQPLGAGGTFTQANYGLKSFDKSTNFDLATDAFTVPANGTGYYQISGSYTCAPVTGQTFGVALYMYKNGAIQKAVASGDQNGTGSITVKLDAGDVVTFWFQTSFPNATVTGSTIDTFMISR